MATITVKNQKATHAGSYLGRKGEGLFPYHHSRRNSINAIQRGARPYSLHHSEIQVHLVPVLKRLRKDIKPQKDKPISYWTANLTWPDNFAEPRAMSSSNNTSKRQRTTNDSQSSMEGKPWAYSQSRKNGVVPEQYTKAYKNYIFSIGLDMDEFKGRELVSPESLETCKVLQTITCETSLKPINSGEETLKVTRLCRNRNEATVARNVTPLILPPIVSFFLKGEGNQFEHLIDEVDTMWWESWVLAGPRPKPHLAVGFPLPPLRLKKTKN